MAQSAAELRDQSARWIGQLQNRSRLNRHLFLVPGITDELASCWAWMNATGAAVISNWKDYATTITFSDIATQYPGCAATDFIDLGACVRSKIIEILGEGGAGDSAQFDIVCHSMGGLDAIAAMVLLGGGKEDGRLPIARYLITLDTPFRGVLSSDIRCSRPDVRDNAWPDRPSQCKALVTGSLQLRALLAARPSLTGRVEQVVCFSADRESPIEVELSSSDLWSDGSPGAAWAAGPTYRAHVIPGACHSGVGGITWSPITIAQVLNLVLFNA